MTYGCNGKPRPTPETFYWAQDGYLRVAAGRVRRDVAIKHVMSTSCQYNKTMTDPKCSGCEHANGGGE